MRRRAVSTAGVIAALAIAAPVAGASAATPRAIPHLPAIANLPAVDGFGGFGGFGGYGGPWAGVAVAIGPTVIGSVFNGGTTVVVSTAPAAGAVNASP
jgi:hypothetical protein